MCFGFNTIYTILNHNDSSIVHTDEVLNHCSYLPVVSEINVGLNPTGFCVLFFLCMYQKKEDFWIILFNFVLLFNFQYVPQSMTLLFIPYLFPFKYT